MHIQEMQLNISIETLPYGVNFLIYFTQKQLCCILMLYITLHNDVYTFWHSCQVVILPMLYHHHQSGLLQFYPSPKNQN